MTFNGRMTWREWTLFSYLDGLQNGERVLEERRWHRSTRKFAGRTARTTARRGRKSLATWLPAFTDDETYFIYELLQNAEDALKRRGEGWKGSRLANFTLDDAQLALSHYGHPFTEKDVRSVCDISESTKDENWIGRFGLGASNRFTRFRTCRRSIPATKTSSLRTTCSPNRPSGNAAMPTKPISFFR
ncbi:sacsin N-terminal ATP-binding-like domain-containing protein [Xanthomonas axonopodis]|uniref:sacsin N-terminal ATP-binding-like domain-containing protein n=1 Tax=Xanthomonas axonopodis TaxID=53413 RepID=UPI001BAFF01F|nr:hypothetical protein [Xanthomonas axonopodis]